MSDPVYLGHDVGFMTEDEAKQGWGCQGCQEQATALDQLRTHIVNLDATLQSVVSALNVVGEQNNWIVENAGRVFSAFEDMRNQFSKGGLMGMVRGMNSGD